LKLPDFAALAMNLRAHPFDLAPHKIKLYYVPARPGPSRFAGEQPSPSDLLVPEGAGGATPDDFAFLLGVHLRSLTGCSP
jgi:hypothetical protein